MDKGGEFESTSLIEFSDSIIRRRKSLNNLFNIVSISKDIRISDDSSSEIAVLILRTAKNTKSPTITVNVWPDRWIWVDVREGARKGWLWSFVIEGRLAGGRTWDDLIQKMKVLANDLQGGVGDEKIIRIKKGWRDILVSGPLGHVAA